MARSRLAHGWGHDTDLQMHDHVHGSVAALAALTAGVAVPLAAIVALVPASLVLPTFSVAMLGFAAAAALFAWATGAARTGERLTAWDVAGLLAFLGCGAAMLSRPEAVLQLFGQAMAG